MGYKIGNTYIKDKDYLEHDREVFTSSCRKDYYNDFCELSKQIRQPKTKMLDILLELLYEEDIMDEFLTRLRKY
jgi:hypothetical protein